MKSKIILWFLAAAVPFTGVYLYFNHAPSHNKGLAPPVVSSMNDQQIASRLRKEIEQKRAKTDLRVMLIGWDAADWQIIDPLLKKGRLPNLNRLLNQGARAYLRSSQPMLSPLLWNSIITGKHPSEHGILDFLVMDTKTQQLVPINSSFRKTMALWNMLTEVGETNAFVAWWATWPAEKTKGYMITDRVSYSLFSSIADKPLMAGLTWPETYYREIKPKLITEKDITDPELARFIHLSPAEIRIERNKQYPPGKTNPVAYLAQVLAGTRNYHQISLDLLRRQSYALFSVYFEGIDQVGHLFQHMMPPKMEMVSDEDYRKYGDVVPVFYEYIDSLTGDLLKYTDQNTVVLLVSDHGFKNGSRRPTDIAPYINEKPAYWHREYGIFLLSGGPVKKRILLDTVSIYDIAPTILYLLGLPVGADFPGRIISDALKPDFQKQFPIQKIASWEPLKTNIHPQQVDSPGDKEMMESLAALGYISQTTESSKAERVTSAFYRNMASLYIHEKNYQRAEQELNKSMKLGVIFETYELLFDIKKGQGKPEEAIQAMLEGFDRFSTVPPESFLRLINLCAEHSLFEAGRQALLQYGSRLPSAIYRLFCEARLLEGVGKIADAEAKYLEVLTLDPTFAYALERLYNIYSKTGNLNNLEALARAGLQKNSDLDLYHNILGVVYKTQGKFHQAIQEYEKALAVDPDNSLYWANLAAAYLSVQQPEKALDLLLRAKRINDQDPEIWLNLGAVYGSLNRNDDALQAFLKARELVGQAPNIELGIAVTYAQKGNFSRARKVTQEALIKFPNDPDLQEFLATLPSP